MKPNLRCAVLVSLALIAGCALKVIILLNQPLMPGHVMPGQGERRGGYQVGFAGWDGWHFGVSQENMLVDQAYGRPCLSYPYANVVELGPVSISH